MLNFSTIALSLTDEQQQGLRGHYGRMLQQLEDGRPLSPQLVEGLRQAMRQALEAQPGLLELIAAGRTQHQLVQLTHADNTLLNLPWRLALEDVPHLYLSKGLPTAQRNERALQNPLPLKVLVMISAPEDTHARLSYEEEEDRIIQAFGPLYEHGQVQVDFTEDGALSSLQRKLKDNHYHILHFSGHGSFRDGQGWLELEDELRMEKQLVSAADFAAALLAKPEHCPALVLLSSCQTAQGGAKEETFQGVSNQLLEIGVPAVVAMGLSISDYFATEFAGKLYQELAEREPLHRAFQSAINHIRQEEARLYPQHLPAQWMIPQLYTNGSLSELVDWEADFKPLSFQNYKFITGQHALLLRRHEGYQFLGRRKERKQALPGLANLQPILLRGQGGVGKTALAEHLAHRLALQDGRLHPFVFNETTARLEDVCKALQAYLRTTHKRLLIEAETRKYSDKAMEQFLFLLQEVLQVCNPCFVFDNLESFQSEPGGPFAPEHSDTQEVIDFLYQNRLCPLLLTGRYPLPDFPEAREIDLNQVRFADFLKKCGQLGLDQLMDKTAEPVLKKTAPSSFRALAEQLHQCFGGNYRALEFFDRLYRQQQGQAQRTLATLHDYLQAHQGEVLHQMSENLVFNQLLALLSEEERCCLGLMYPFRRPVLPLAIAMQEAGIPDEEAALERLVQLTLLERQTEPLDTQQSLTYYYLTPLVRGMMEQVQMERPAFVEEKAGDYYYYAVRNIQSSVADGQEAWQHYYAAGQQARVNEIGDVLCTFYWNTSQFQLSYHYGLHTEQLLGQRTHDRIYNNLGLLLDLYGHYDAALAYYEKSLAIKQEKGDRQGEGVTLNNISQIHQVRGDYDNALDYLEQSLAIRQQIGDRQGEGVTLSNLAITAYAKGDYESALHYLEQSLAIVQQIGDRKGEGVTLNNISQIYDAKGDYDNALRYLEQSLAISQQIGDRKGEGATLNNLATTAYAKGDYDNALRYLEQSLAIRQQIGDRQGEGVTLNNISQIHQVRGDYDNALHYLEQSLAIVQQIGDRKGEGVTLNNISQIYDAKGDYDNALRYLEQSLAIQQQIGDRQGEGVTLNNISQIHQVRGDYDNALHYLEQSLAISQQIGDRKNESVTLNNIGQIHRARGNYDEALRYAEMDLAICQQIGDRQGESVTLNNIGQIHRARGNYDEALRYAEMDLAICQQIGDISGMATTLHNMGATYVEMERFEAAVLPLVQAYQIREKLQSPDLPSTVSYLNFLVEKLGEARFQQILQQQNP
jgi:tetratricopeptide (TPR) repeat protein